MAAKGRFLATCISPQYWFVKYGWVNWIGPNTVEVSEKHPRGGPTWYAILRFKTEAEIRQYFSLFKTVHVGREGH